MRQNIRKILLKKWKGF